MIDVLTRAVEEKTQTSPIKFGNAQVIKCFQLNQNGLLGAFYRCLRVPKTCRDHLNRPEGDRMTCAEPAWSATDWFGIKRSISIYFVSGWGDALLQRFKLYNRHGGYGIDVMRIDDVE